MTRNLSRIVGFLILSFQLSLPNLRADEALPPPAGLVGWWSGDGYCFDLSTNHLDGFGMNGVAFTNGEVAQGFSFAGGAYVRLPDNLFPYPLQGTGITPFTFELWFKTTTGGVILGQQIVDVNASVPTSYVPGLYVGTDGNLRGSLFWNGSPSPITSSNSVNDGLFHHLAVVYDGTNEARFYNLHCATNLVSGSWTNVPGQTNVRGSGSHMTLSDTNMTSLRFYRVGVQATSTP